MNDQNDPPPNDETTDRNKASVLEALGTLIGDDSARRDGARRKQAPDATKPDAAEDLPGDR